MFPFARKSAQFKTENKISQGTIRGLFTGEHFLGLGDYALKDIPWDKGTMPKEIWQGMMGFEKRDKPLDEGTVGDNPWD